MINNYRTAFHSKSPNDALEYNLEKIVNLTQVKLKELISKKREKSRENNFVKAQRGVFIADIAHYEREVDEKSEQISKLNEEFSNIDKEIQELENEYKNCKSEYDTQVKNMRKTEKSVVEDLDSISISEGIEETIKKTGIKMEHEKYHKIKNENVLLVEQLFELRRELYYLEINYKKAADFEIQRIYRARKGIETINKLEMVQSKQELNGEEDQNELNEDFDHEEK